MKNYTFHWEKKKLITQFIGALNNCIVKRYDENLEVKSEIEVRYVYAPKTRTLHWLVNKQQHITLPVVSVYIEGISRDQSRVFNKIDGPTYLQKDQINDPPRIYESAIASGLQPIPIDIRVSMSVLTKYQNDADQIICNFVPYFDPYIMLSWEDPNIDMEIRSPVLWDGSLTYNYPTELNASDSYRVGIDTTFTIKGWMFKKSDSDLGLIEKVFTDFYGVDDLDGIDGLLTDEYLDYESTLDGDHFIVTKDDL